MPPITGHAEAAHSIDDFELVRNGDGQWLLVLPEVPDSLIGDPTAPAYLALEEDELFLMEGTVRHRFSSLVAGHYVQALRTDKPTQIMVCAVDDDGGRHMIRKLPIRV